MSLPGVGGRERDHPWWLVPVAVAGGAGVAAYVASWAVAGMWHADYDPVSQAISELFARGAPPASSRLVRASLVVTGALLVPFGAALDRGLPGEGRAGPVAAAVSGVMTVLVAVFPCSEGCPGMGTSLTDSAHTAVAGIGYGALIAGPLLTARRLRGHDDRFASVSLALGGLALAGFVARSLGWADAIAGLQQRLFNTTADLWYLLAAVEIVRRARGGDGEG